MRYGIVSDVHGNLEALLAVLDRLGGVDAIVCPGDIVGYGADPNACCDIIREKSRATVLGNHDAAAVGLMDLDWFNSAARSAALWTRDRLSEENALFLKGLPARIDLPDFLLVHATPADPLGFEYILSPWEALPAFQEMGSETLCLIGHSHIAEYYTLEEDFLNPLQFSLRNGGVIQLKPEVKYIVNCGSVGQPRDGNPLACFGVYDTEAGTIEVQRTDYDVQTAQKKIREAGLPRELAERLTLGR